MNFTFLEFFLIIFFASFIIFSLSIKDEANKKYLSFKEYVSRIIERIDKEIKIKTNHKKNIIESLLLQSKIFKESTDIIIDNIYHTFYVIFFFSSLGTFITLITEMNIFGLNQYIPIDIINNYILSIFAIILLCSVIRGAFLLICYTKIDNIRYIERIITKVQDVMEYNLESTLNQEKYVRLGKLKINIFSILFFIFRIRNKKFIKFFYTFYQR